jgi:hypothetical protein
MKKAVLAVAAMAVLAGCTDLNDTQQRALTGTAIGAGTGLVVGGIAGDAGVGAAVGAGVGLLGGLLYDRQQKSQGN